MFPLDMPCVFLFCSVYLLTFEVGDKNFSNLLNVKGRAYVFFWDNIGLT